jgi:hypothetical protein
MFAKSLKSVMEYRGEVCVRQGPADGGEIIVGFTVGRLPGFEGGVIGVGALSDVHWQSEYHKYALVMLSRKFETIIASPIGPPVINAKKSAADGNESIVGGSFPQNVGTSPIAKPSIHGRYGYSHESTDGSNDFM